MRADGMLEAEYEGQRFLIDVECQSTKDEEIDERMLGYSYEGTRAHNLPMYSCALYLRHVFEPPQSPLTRHVPVIGEVLKFKYGSIELAEIPVEELEQKGLVGLAPLFLLAKGGATHAVLERALTMLEAAHKVESLAILRLIASIVFTRAEDIAWVKWRFAHMHDFLLESSWMYQELVKEGEIKGLEEGREQGIRQSIEEVVKARFPKLVDLAKERLEHIQDQQGLHMFLVAMSTTSTERAARRYLLAL